MTLTLKSIIAYIEKLVKYDKNQQVTEREEKIKNKLDFGEKIQLNDLFDDIDIYRLGIDYTNNNVCISFYSCIISYIFYNYYKLEFDDRMIHVDRLIEKLSKATRDYKYGDIKQKDLKEAIKKFQTSDIIIQYIAEYFKLNIIVVTLNNTDSDNTEKYIFTQYGKNDKYTKFNNIILLYKTYHDNKNYFEPLIAKNKMIFEFDMFTDINLNIWLNNDEVIESKDNETIQYSINHVDANKYLNDEVGYEPKIRSKQTTVDNVKKSKKDIVSNEKSSYNKTKKDKQKKKNKKVKK